MKLYMLFLFAVLPFISQAQNQTWTAPFNAQDRSVNFKLDSTCNCTQYGSISLYHYQAQIRLNQIHPLAQCWEWEFTQTSPVQGKPWVYKTNSNDLRLNHDLRLSELKVDGNVLEEGSTYDVRVRPVFKDGSRGEFGSIECFQTIGGTGGIAHNEKELTEIDLTWRYAMEIPWQGIINHVTSDTLQFIIRENQYDQIKVKLYDPNGNLSLTYKASICQEHGAYYFEIDLPSKLPGIHQAKISVNNKTWSEKFLVQSENL